MAYAQTSTLRGTLTARIHTALSALSARMEQRRTFLRTRNELSALSDHNLADLGLTRAEITRVSMQTSMGLAR